MSDAPAATAVTVTDNGNGARMITMNFYAHDSKISKRKLYSTVNKTSNFLLRGQLLTLSNTDSYAINLTSKVPTTRSVTLQTPSTCSDLLKIPRTQCWIC